MNTDHELTGNAMTFSSPMDAKKFLAGKIAAEAANRGMHLSEGEQKLLLFSEQDPESPVDIPEELLEGVDEEYERKITSLLKSAYERDRENPLERQRYEDAMKTLDGSDHYILVMADVALPGVAKTRNIDGGQPGSHKRLILIYVLIGVGVLIAIVAYMLH
jgi:hypothetical protein